MKKRKPKHLQPDGSDTMLSPLGTAKAAGYIATNGKIRWARGKGPTKTNRYLADAALRDAEKAAIEHLAADRTKRRHGAAALLKTLEAIKTARALNEAEKRIGARPDPWDLPEGQTQSDPGITSRYCQMPKPRTGMGARLIDGVWVPMRDADNPAMTVDEDTGSIGIGSSSKPLAHPVRERMDLVPWNAVLAVAQTMTEGIKTHDEGAWRKLSQREHISRAMRHLALFLTGDCAEPHLFNAACRTLMALETPEPLPF